MKYILIILMLLSTTINAQILQHKCIPNLVYIPIIDTLSKDAKFCYHKIDEDDITMSDYHFVVGTYYDETLSIYRSRSRRGYVPSTMHFTFCLYDHYYDYKGLMCIHWSPDSMDFIFYVVLHDINNKHHRYHG